MQIPKGIALALQSVLGIDAGTFVAKFDEAFNHLKSTLLHFDGRLLAIEKELASLREKIYGGNS